MSTQAHLDYRNRRRRRYKRAEYDFASLIESPFDLGTDDAGNDLPNTFDLPANARLGFSASEALDAGDVTVTIGSNAYPVPALAADEIHRLLFEYEGKEVTVSAGAGCPACDVTLYFLDRWRRESAIATGSVTVA